MKKAAIGVALSLANLGLVGGMIVASMNVPANAQGVAGTFKKPFSTAGYPKGYKSGKSKDDNCYPSRDNAPAVFPRRSTSDQCPQGYFSRSDMTICNTRLSPAPKSRKKTGAYNSNEIDEWGLCCNVERYGVGNS